MRYLLTSLACLLLLGCESTHTTRKIIQNESSYLIQLHYFSSIYDMDSIYNLPENSSVDIEFFQKLGNHPCALPSSPCSISENDTLIVLFDDATIDNGVCVFGGCTISARGQLQKRFRTFELDLPPIKVSPLTITGPPLCCRVSTHAPDDSL